MTQHRRRSLLLGAAAASMVAATQSLARSRTALATDGEALVIGETASATTETRIEHSGVESAALTGFSSGSGAVGLGGHVTSSSGESAGLFGLASAASGLNAGVVGQSKSSQGTGIRARAVSPSGATFGLYASVESPAGVGVYTESARGDGVALQAVGRVRFSTSGLATIRRGKNSVVIAPGVPLTKTTKVLCTLQSSPGGTTVIQSIDKTVGQGVFAIVLTANATATTKVAWFVID